MSPESVEVFDNRTAARDGAGSGTSRFASRFAEEAAAFHRSIPGYSPTALHPLPALAAALGVSAVWVKDESTRFGLNAFKGLGASYAVAGVLAGRLERDVAGITFGDLTSPVARAALGDLVFATATDGNHGRGVAWAAQQLGQKAAVFLPSHAAPVRVERIRGHGAETTVTDCNYDDTVRIVAAEAERRGWVLIQDTVWEGYEEVPVWIMQGYLTMLAEALEQAGELPTHLFIQAGVGSFAGALQGYLVERYGARRPLLAVVEPLAMASCFASARAGDGRSRAIVDAHHETIMACLAAGENNPLAWPILRDHADFFVRCPDQVAESGMRSLAHPGAGDARVVSGESGAVTAGLLIEAGNDGRLFRELQLDADSKVLLFSTEGAGDSADYRRITGTEP